MKALPLASVSFAVLLAGSRASAQPAAFEVHASSFGYLAAESVVVVKGAPPDAKPNAAASVSANFAVVAVENENGAWKWTVLPLSTGTLRFTPAFTTKDGRELKAASPPISVTELPLPKDAEILDIKPPLKAWPALWPFLLAAALAYGAWYAWRRYQARLRPGAPGAPAAPALPPERVATDAINALLASGRWEADQASFYLELTDILRAYLESRWGKPATAMTSAEVARLVKDRAGDLNIAGAVRELLGRADMVKFARAKPGPQDGPNDAALALSVVSRTTPPDPLKREKELAR